MPKIMSTRMPLTLKRGRGIDGNRLSMCSSKHDMDSDIDMSFSFEPKEGKGSSSAIDKDKMSEIVNKLSKIKIVNPKNSAKAKREIKNKYITI